MSGPRGLVRAPRVVSCDPARATSADPLGAIDDAAIVIEDGRVAWVGARAELAGAHAALPLLADAPGVVTPGLVDAHTHAAWMGSREREYAMRMEGADYEAIAAAGGGIVASMRAVRAAKTDAIAATLAARLRRMASLGVTTVEVKSGYGLDEAGERKQLDAIAEARLGAGLPRVVPTYLALHALPPEAKDRDAYARLVASSWLPAIAGAKLAAFVDAYVDRAAFTVDQARLVLGRAKELGLGVRLHAGQFADVGAAELARELGAASADHLENVGPAGVDALAAGGVRAGLLPIASFTLKQAPPPIAAMRGAGVAFVVASDANPGTAPSESLPLALAFAVRAYGLTIAEALLGATREAAASLGLARETGAIAPGLAADLALWELPHEAALAQPWGVAKVARVLLAGRAIA